MSGENEIPSLIEQTRDERNRLIDLVQPLTGRQARYKPAPDVWSVNENLEHLVLAEVSGTSKIWAAAEGVRTGEPVWAGEHTNRGLSIEEIVARTWKPKETAPPIAMPHIGGPVAWWVEYLKSAQSLLDSLAPALRGLDPETVLFPHFLCGPLDARQRIQFLRFHIRRHRNQITVLMAEPGFPG
jgi:hypothetical protein